jgi:hypothetical protein
MKINHQVVVFDAAELAAESRFLGRSARWHGRRATTVARGQQPALAIWADAGGSPCSLSLPSW